jgi:cytochrome b pre-mRNA-processing protein 3
VAEKRYELIVLHIVIVLERLRAAGAPGMAVGQALVEAFVSDLDGSIREMALGDTKVPANVKKAAGGLFDRDVLYRQAFSNSASTSDSEPMTLAELLSELVFEGGNEDGAARLLRYTTNARAALAEWEPLGADTLPPFPKPAAIVREKT